MGTSNCLIEMAVGTVANRHNRVTLGELPSFIKPKQELYRSMFIYDESFDGSVPTLGGAAALRAGRRMEHARISP